MPILLPLPGYHPRASFPGLTMTFVTPLLQFLHPPPAGRPAGTCITISVDQEKQTSGLLLQVRKYIR